MTGEGCLRGYSMPVERPLRNLSRLFKPAATTLSPAIHNLSGGNTLTNSKYPRGRDGLPRNPQQVSPVATADIPGGDELYLTAGERSVTRGRQHATSRPRRGRTASGKRDGEWKALPVVHYPLSTVHCSRRSPPSGTHTHVASHPRVTLTPFAHPRLSMVGPLRGPSAGRNQTGFCSSLVDRRVTREVRHLPAQCVGACVVGSRLRRRRDKKEERYSHHAWWCGCIARSVCGGGFLRSLPFDAFGVCLRRRLAYLRSASFSST